MISHHAITLGELRSSISSFLPRPEFRLSSLEIEKSAAILFIVTRSANLGLKRSSKAEQAEMKRKQQNFDQSCQSDSGR